MPNISEISLHDTIYKLKDSNAATKEELAAALENIDVPMGVYVGSGEMPENCNLKIDPNGDTVDIWTEIKNYLDELEVGSSKPDVTMRAIPYEERESHNNYVFSFTPGSHASLGYSWGPDGIIFNQEEIVSAYEKVVDNKPVNCLFTNCGWLNSWEGNYNTCYSLTRIAASKERETKCLVMNFLCNTDLNGYINLGKYDLEYLFEVNTENRTATIYAANAVKV